MQQADLFEKRLLELQEKLEASEGDRLHNQTSLTSRQAGHGVHKHISQFDPLHSLNSLENNLPPQAHFSYSIPQDHFEARPPPLTRIDPYVILEDIVSRFKSIQTNGMASEMIQIEYTLKMKKNPGFYVNIFGALNQLDFMNLAMILYEVVEEVIFEGGKFYFAEIKEESPDQGEELFELHNKLSDNEGLVQSLRTEMERKTDYLNILLEERERFRSWVNSLILMIADVLGTLAQAGQLDGLGFLIGKLKLVSEIGEVLQDVNLGLREGFEDLEQFLSGLDDKNQKVGKMMHEINKESLDYSGLMNKLSQSFGEMISLKATNADLRQKIDILNLNIE